MTNEEAIKELEYARTCVLRGSKRDEVLCMAIEALQAQMPTCNDAISRQAAIDIERNATVDTNPSHFEAHQKFVQFMDDAEISSFGRWQWSNGFNTALTAVGIDLRRLPSAQPEIIACGDCKHWICHDRRCGFWNHGVKPLDWCCHAERRDDEMR